MSYIEKLKNPWYVRVIFWLQKRKYGQPLNSAKIWAKSPRVFLALSCLYGALERTKSPLSPQLRTLVIVRVSQLNGCAFCIDLNTATLVERGVPIEKIQDLHQWRTSQHFNDHEKHVLDYTESVTLATGHLDESSKQSIRTVLSDAEIVELTALIAFQNMSTKFNNAFGVEPQGFCKVKIK